MWAPFTTVKFVAKTSLVGIISIDIWIKYMVCTFFLFIVVHYQNFFFDNKSLNCNVITFIRENNRFQKSISFFFSENVDIALSFKSLFKFKKMCLVFPSFVINLQCSLFVWIWKKLWSVIFCLISLCVIFLIYIYSIFF